MTKADRTYSGSTTRVAGTIRLIHRTDGIHPRILYETANQIVNPLQLMLQSSFNNKLETKASSHEGQCIPAGYCHAYMLLYESGVNYNVNGKYTNYNRTTMRPNFYVLEYFHHILASFVAPSIDRTATCLVGYKAQLVL